MKHVISEINFYNGRHCLFSSIYSICKSKGLPYSETDIFFICNGLEIRYGTSMNFFWQFPFEKFLKSFGSKCLADEIYFLDMKAGTWDSIFEAIKADKVVILNIYSNYLPYIDSSFGDSFKHMVLLYGFDIEMQEAYIIDLYSIDPSGKVLTYNGKVKLSNIMEGTFGCAWFNAKTFRILSRDDIIEIANTNLNFYISDSVPDIDGNYTGIQALRKYFEDISSITELNDNEFKKMILRIYQELRLESIINLIDYIKDYINENLDCSNKAVSKILIGLDENYKLWKKVLLYLYKIGIRVQREQITKLIYEAMQAIDLFEKLLKEVIKLNNIAVIVKDKK